MCPRYRGFSDSVTRGGYWVSFQLTLDEVQLKAEIMVTTGYAIAKPAAV
jgi:hypothetical protein